MGAVTTWFVMMQIPQLFRSYLPLSGDCWAFERRSSVTRPKETAQVLISCLQKAGLMPDDIFIYGMRKKPCLRRWVNILTGFVSCLSRRAAIPAICVSRAACTLTTISASISITRCRTCSENEKTPPRRFNLRGGVFSFTTNGEPSGTQRVCFIWIKNRGYKQAFQRKNWVSCKTEARTKPIRL